MVLEATMIVVDNSEFTRNGDYLTTRFDAQLDSVDYLFQAKVNSNPENTCGLLSAGGDGPIVLSSLTADFGRILKGIHETKVEGTFHFVSAIQVATLVLKHRQNTHQHQRVIVFVASPIAEEEQELTKLAKKLKKNDIGIDVVNFGEEQYNTSKLEKFVELVNKDDNSHLLTVPAGPKLLYEHIASSPILLEEGATGAGGFGVAGGAGGDDFFDMGSDPNMDPELALALRLSLEEERARQEREQARQQQEQQEQQGSAAETDDKESEKKSQE